MMVWEWPFSKTSTAYFMMGCIVVGIVFMFITIFGLFSNTYSVYKCNIPTGCFVFNASINDWDDIIMYGPNGDEVLDFVWSGDGLVFEGYTIIAGKDRAEQKSRILTSLGLLGLGLLIIGMVFYERPEIE